MAWSRAETGKGGVATVGCGSRPIISFTLYRRPNVAAPVRGLCRNALLDVGKISCALPRGHGSGDLGHA